MAIDLKVLEEGYNNRQPLFKDAEKQLKRGFEDFVDDNPDLGIYSWKVDIKKIDSFLDKAQRKAECGVTTENAFEMITDVLRGRFVVWLVDQIMPLVNMIEELFPNFIIKERVDYLTEPKKETGYYGFHLVGDYIINGKTPMKCEIQVRSFLGHGYSEVEHICRYKPTYGEVDDELKQILDENFRVASEGILAAEKAFCNIYNAVKIRTAPTKLFPTKK